MCLGPYRVSALVSYPNRLGGGGGGTLRPRPEAAIGSTRHPHRYRHLQFTTKRHRTDRNRDTQTTERRHKHTEQATGHRTLTPYFYSISNLYRTRCFASRSPVLSSARRCPRPWARGGKMDFK